MTAVSPKRPHEAQCEFAIADLRHAGRELTQCGTLLPFALVLSGSYRRFEL